MLKDIQTEYKGFTLIFNPDTEEWRIDGEGYGNGSKSFKVIKQKVDSLSRKDFERFEAWYLGWRSDEIEVVTVTSITEDGEIWIIRNKRGKERRTKEKASDLFKITDANKTILASMRSCGQEVSKLDKKIGELRNGLETITGRKFGEYK